MTEATSLNLVRGEVPLIVKGKTYVLCLTLGALAELERTLELEDLTKVGEVFKAPKASSLMKLLLALLHGGTDPDHPERAKQADLTEDDVLKMPLLMHQVMIPLKEAFEASTALKGEDTEPGKE